MMRRKIGKPASGAGDKSLEVASLAPGAACWK